MLTLRIFCVVFETCITVVCSMSQILRLYSFSFPLTDRVKPNFGVWRCLALSFMISIAYTYLIEFLCLCVVFQVFSITVRWSNNKRFQIYRQYSDVLTLQVCEWMPFHLSVRLAVCPSVHPSVHPPVYLSILLSIHRLFSKLPMYMYMSAIHNTVT